MQQSYQSSYADYIHARLDAMQANRSSVEDQIMAALEAGPLTSLFQLAVVNLGIAYYWAWVIVQRLEAQGRITVDRRPGKPLVIRRKD